MGGEAYGFLLLRAKLLHEPVNPICVWNKC